MKPPPVGYETPTTVAEAVDLLAEHLDEASVLAGGQSLTPLLALRLTRPAVLIDINGIGELSGVSATDGWGAIRRRRQLPVGHVHGLPDADRL
jgi:aerobic carbon-monoxide dehydrogenase medium subunit